MLQKYNSQYFGKDDCDSGLLTNFIRSLLAFNLSTSSQMNDIHIGSDEYAGGVVVEWKEINKKYRDDFGKFEFVDSDQCVADKVDLPDGTIALAAGAKEAQEVFDAWLASHKTWKQNKINGRWYDTSDEAKDEEKWKEAE